MAALLDFPVFDADHHLYETEDALTRHLPAQHKDLFRFAEINGRKKLLVRSQLTEFIPNPTFEVIARPGAHEAFFAGNNPEGKTLRELTGKPIQCPPAFRNPKDRLALMDEQGIHSCLMFPTLASLIEERLKDDSYLTGVAIRAFNDWLHDDWSYHYEGRIFATPIVSPCDAASGIAELDRVLERGRGSSSSARLRSPASRAPARRSCRSSTRSGPASRRPAWSWRCTPPTAATRTT